MHRLTYLRLSITDRCDMACNYCVPYRRALAHAGSVLTVDEIGTLVAALACYGVRKVRLTGGEPLLRDDVVEIVRRIAGTIEIETVGLTTNGVRLAELASELAEAGLQRVNISVDSLNREAFRQITGRDALEDVLTGIDAALQCGFGSIRLNTVVMRGTNDREVPAIADFAAGIGVEARFIELMPLGHSSAQWQAMHVPAAEIRRMLGDLEPLPNEIGASAKRYKRGCGVVGIISPMSEDFCADCNRIRVACSGKLRPCLRLPVEEDLRPYLHSPKSVAEMIDRLSDCKLPRALACLSAVQSEAMCAVGG